MLDKKSKVFISGSAFLVILSAILLFVSYDARDWVSVYLLTSEVSGKPDLPPFSTPPRDSTKKYLGFLAIGDAGTGAFGQKTTAAGMEKKAGQDSVSFILYLGDNFYEFGVRSVDDRQWQSKFEQIYTSPLFNIPFYAVLGNHDYRQNPQAQVEYTRKSTRWYMPHRFYTIAHQIDDSTSARFYCLDTQPMAYLSPEDLETGKDSAVYMPQLRWLRAQLSESSARWNFVLGHHPLYSNGVHGDNKELAALLEPLFVQYSVDFYLSGHDHHLELLEPVKGVNYIVSGGGGKHRDVAWRENTVYAGTNLGFVFFAVSREGAIAEFIDRNGVTQYVHRFSKGTRNPKMPASTRH